MPTHYSITREKDGYQVWKYWRSDRPAGYKAGWTLIPMFVRPVAQLEMAFDLYRRKVAS